MRGSLVPAAVILAAACALVASQAGLGAGPPVPDAPVAGNTTGFLSECLPLAEAKMARCYVRGLLRAVEKFGNPARGLPRIDRKVHEAGGFLEAACHSLMHEVGRTWARRHDVTIENLFKFVPRSNDPGCSAGFGMGLAMYLGPQLVVEPRSLLRTCSQLPTRYREYTCVHGAGHAFMRGFHGYLRDAVTACNKLGARAAPDCAQGAFHDYWISLGGGDDTARPENADTSPRSVCRGYSYKRPCWYRFFWERRTNERVSKVTDIDRLCVGLVELQRAGCVSGASLLMSRALVPVDHARTCGDLSGSDAIDCLRGVAVPAVAHQRLERLRLVRTCADFPEETRSRCFGWFGRTLAVVTDGRFRRDGCPRLGERHARAWCEAGAARLNRPLRTFS